MIDLQQARNLYISGYRDSIRRNKCKHEKLAPEVLLQLSEKPNLYRNLFRVDMIYVNEGMNTVLEANTDSQTLFEKEEENYKGAKISLGPVVWNGIDLTADQKNEIPIDSWYLKWADIEDENPSDEDGLGSVPVESFFELLDLIVSNGSTVIDVRSNHPENE